MGNNKTLKKRFKELKKTYEFLDLIRDTMNETYLEANGLCEVYSIVEGEHSALASEILEVSCYYEYFGKAKNYEGFYVDNVYEMFLMCKTYKSYCKKLKDLMNDFQAQELEGTGYGG